MVRAPSTDKSLDSLTYNADGSATASYTITLSNPTSSALSDYVLSDTMTNGTIVAGSVSGATYDAGAHTFTVANVPAASGTTPGTASFSYKATIADASTFSGNIAFPASSDWTLAKTRVTGNGSTVKATSGLSVGDDVWYLLTIDNSGNASILQNSAATSPTPSGISITWKPTRAREPCRPRARR